MPAPPWLPGFPPRSPGPSSTRPIPSWPRSARRGRLRCCARTRCRCRCSGRSAGGWPSASDSGERVIDTTDWRRWTATALDVIAGQPQVCSFADLTLDEWMAAWARKFHADHGRLPAAGSRQRAESALRGLLPRLAIRYSDKPWWQHDVWCLRFDPRIPRREHEPRGESSVRWDDIEPRWLRDGFTFWMQLQLESGQLTWSSAAPWHVFASRFSEFAVSRWLGHPALTGDPARTAAADAGLPGVPAPVAAGDDRGQKKRAGRWTTGRSPAPSGSSATSTGRCTTTRPRPPPLSVTTGGWRSPTPTPGSTGPASSSPSGSSRRPTSATTSATPTCPACSPASSCSACPAASR